MTVHRGGAESWRFAHDIDQSLHNALYVRDALGLVIDEQVDAPPRLMGDIPDRSGLLDADGLGAAAAQWASLVAVDGRRESHRTVDVAVDYRGSTCPGA